MLLASDYDNTLCFAEKISDEDREAIAAFRKNNLFGIVTGRTPQSLAKELELHRLPIDFAITGSGAIIEIEGKRFRSVYLPRGFVIELRNRLARDERISHAYLFSETGCAPIRQEGPFVHGTIDLVPPEAADLDRVFGFGGIRMKSEDGFLSSEELGRRMSERYGDIVSIHVNTRFVDLSPIGVDKATSLGALAAELGVPRGEVYAIGDGGNDLSMLRAFHGVKMAKSSKALAEITQSADSVADLIRKLQ